MMKRFTLVEIIVCSAILSILLAIVIESCGGRMVKITTEEGEKGDDGGPVIKTLSKDFSCGVYVVEYEGEIYLVNNQGGIVHHQKGEAKSHESDR